MLSGCTALLPRHRTGHLETKPEREQDPGIVTALGYNAPD